MCPWTGVWAKACLLDGAACHGYTLGWVEGCVRVSVSVILST